MTHCTTKSNPELLRTRPRMTRNEKQIMLRLIVRVPELFNLASTRLRADHFDPSGEAELRWVWLAALAATRKYCPGRLPTDPALAWAMVEAEARAASDAGIVHHERSRACDTVNDLFAWIFAWDGALDQEHGKQLLIRFLEERELADYLMSLATTTDGETLADLSAVARELQHRHAQISILSQ
jgi:hypothetical protein